MSDNDFKREETTNFEMICNFGVAPSIDFLLVDIVPTERTPTRPVKAMTRGERVRRESTRRGRRLQRLQWQTLIA